MLKSLFLILGVVTVSYARPESFEFGPRNVVTVPPNCPEGQEWVNGVCRDVWRNSALPSNMITVPPNCPPGTVFINGQCRDVWRFLGLLAQREPMQVENIVQDVNDLSVPNQPRNIITIPNQCPAGYKPDALGYCRKEF